MQMANALGRALPGPGTGTTGSRCPPDEVLCILLPGFLSPGPWEAELKVAPSQGAKRVGHGSASQKGFTKLVLGSEQDEVVTALLHQ